MCRHGLVTSAVWACTDPMWSDEGGRHPAEYQSINTRCKDRIEPSQEAK